MIVGIFKEELKNRFRAIVTVNGVDTLCYVPASCHLSQFVDLVGRQVLLTPTKKQPTKTKYSIYAVRYRNSYAFLNLAEANRIVEKEIKRKTFSFLGNRTSICREKGIAGYKSDLFIEDTDMIIEIKSILTFKQKAIFPTVYSVRANRQLDKIKNLLKEGYQVNYILAALYPGIKHIAINNQQKEFYQKFEECVAEGMQVHGVALALKNGEPYVRNRVEVEF